MIIDGSSTKLHIGRDGYWRRCVAKFYPGRGVEECPVGGTHFDHSSIALSGGGTIARSERMTTVSAFDEETGTYTLSTGSDNERVSAWDPNADGNNNTARVTHYDRRTEEQIDARAAKNRFVGPSREVIEYNSKPEPEVQHYKVEGKDVSVLTDPGLTKMLAGLNTYHGIQNAKLNSYRGEQRLIDMGRLSRAKAAVIIKDITAEANAKGYSGPQMNRLIHCSLFYASHDVRMSPKDCLNAARNDLVSLGHFDNIENV